MSFYRSVMYPVASRIDAESTHNAALKTLALVSGNARLRNTLRHSLAVEDPRLRTSVAGLDFANPVGLSAGFDKTGRVVNAFAALGAGFAEIGTVTPLGQPGRPRPRIFRLVEDKAVVNAMGFPNPGMRTVAANLHKRVPEAGVIGVNVGPNKVSVEEGRATGDYVQAIQMLYPLADYITVNMSSPNTPGLTALQTSQTLTEVLDAVVSTRDTFSDRKPVFLKISPDMEMPDLDRVIQAVMDRGIGLITTNTTVNRLDTLRSSNRDKPGALSGEPLRQRATEVLRYVARHTEGKLPIIGVGGIFTADDAIEKLLAGASLVQVYTGFIYQGYTMFRELNRGIVAYLDRSGAKSIGEIVGAEMSKT
jgi:dihydroorotate dehydrogenase